MSTQPSDSHFFIFPPWLNKLPKRMGIALLFISIGMIGGIYYYGSPKNTDVGYQPNQPVPYSHKLHAGIMGMDCRYCHTGVEKSSVASIPSTQICMNCHKEVKKDSPALALVTESWANNKPIPWTRVHKLADYVYFPHNAHVNIHGGVASIGCESCHGRIDQMDKVRQTKELSMGWCLDCHRNPASSLRPGKLATQMGEQPTESAQARGENLIKTYNISPPTDCSRCHR